VLAWSYNDLEFYSFECELGLLVTGNDLEFYPSRCELGPLTSSEDLEFRSF
jgi:hypothetical protein